MSVELQTLLTALYATVLILAVTLISAVWVKKELAGAKDFIAMELGIALYAFAALMEVTTQNFQGKVLWNSVETTGMLVVIAAFPIFALAYAERRTEKIVRALVPFWAFCLTSVIMVWTNQWHHLYFSSLTITDVGGTGVLIESYGIWAICQFAVALGIDLLAIYYVTRASAKWQARKRQQGLVIMGAFILPPLFGAVYIFAGIQYVDLILVSFLLSSSLLFVALYRFNLFRLVPAASDHFFDAIEDAVLVVDDQRTILEANPAAVAMVGSTLNNVVGKNIDWYSRSIGAEAYAEAKLQSGETELEIEGPDGRRNLDVRCSTIDIPQSNSKGFLLMVRDVTEKRRAERQISISNEKLRILDSVTRHDIMNKSMAIAGYAALLRDGLSTDRQRRFLEGIVKSNERITEECNFAKTYIDLGVKTPAWQELDMVLINSSSSLSFGDIQLYRDVEGLEAYADPMLEIVFHNLFDNSLRHGEKVTRISVSARRDPADWKIIYQDDGVGIPMELKERIFEEGFGKNTGLGLDLCRRILAITGITIHESGAPQEGAMFVMTVPLDKIRSVGAHDASRPQLEPAGATQDLNG